MKKSVLKFKVLAVVVVCVLVSCSTVNAQSNKSFIYDKKDNSEVIYSLDKKKSLLTRELKYEFQYGNNGEVTEKKAYRWNEKSESWTPYYVITFSSSESGSVMQYAQWNNQSGEYNLNQQKTVYHIDAMNEVVSYISYKWNSEQNQWLQDDHLLLQHYFAEN